MAQPTLTFRHTTEVAAPPQKVPNKLKSFRPDIQGLRAVAVIAVILDHMLGFPSGGFVGVDVFFVISGFVITASLLRDHAKKDRISFTDFYRHRARRILPAATLVVLATVAASWLMFRGERAQSVLWDGIWASLFGANWRFAATGTDYLQADGPTSPLQHYWSLSVEEQFYFVWPALMVLVLGTLATRFNWTKEVARRILGLAMLAISVVSLGFAFWETTHAPTVAYFSTFSRAWELGLGALIAVLIPVFARIPAALRPVLQWVGLAGIIASLFLINAQTPFPAPGAALPVFSTALVILGGVGGQRCMAPLTNRTTRYVGDISYSLYLWHFPVIILMKAAFPSLGLLHFTIIAVVIVLLSVASYHFLEDPIRRSEWLEPRTRRGMQESKSMSFSTKMLGLALLTVASLGVSGLALLQQLPASTADRSAQIAAARFTPAPTASERPATPEEALQTKIARSLQATEWPKLKPSLDELGYDAWAPEITQDGCLTVTDDNFGKCAYGSEDSTKIAAVVGDSIAASWMPAIRGALEREGYRIQMLTRSGCPPYDVSLKAEGAAACSEHRAWTSQKLLDLKPSLILVSQAYEDNAETEGKTPEAAAAAWKESGIRFAATLPAESSLAYIQGPKGGKDLNECATRTSAPADCVSDINGFGAMIERANSDATVAAATPSRKALYVETTSWFCINGKCPGFIGSTPVRIDGSHLTGEFSKSLSTVMAPALSSLVEK